MIYIKANLYGNTYYGKAEWSKGPEVGYDLKAHFSASFIGEVREIWFAKNEGYEEVTEKEYEIYRIIEA